MTAVARPLARPFAAAGVALVAAGTISATAAGPAAPAIPTLELPGITLQASVLDILTLPVYRQSITNAIEFLGIEVNGAVQAAGGVVTSIGSIAPTLSTALQQLSTNDIAGALQTVNDAIVAAGTAIFGPPIAATITVAQQQLAIQGALQLAVPLAYLDVAKGLSSAFTGFSTALILAAQSIAAAVATFNLNTIVTAVGEGVQSVAQAAVAGGGDIVEGIANAQTGLVTALQTRVAPVPPPNTVTPPAASTPRSSRVAAPTPAAATLSPVTAAASVGDVAPRAVNVARSAARAAAGSVATAVQRDVVRPAASRRAAR